LARASFQAHRANLFFFAEDSVFDDGTDFLLLGLMPVGSLHPHSFECVFDMVFGKSDPGSDCRDVVPFAVGEMLGNGLADERAALLDSDRVFFDHTKHGFVTSLFAKALGKDMVMPS
jgi:hypothetical protein